MMQQPTSDAPRMKLEPFEAALRAMPEGDALAGAFETHVEEVISLINNNRRVGVIWQRNKGPLFVRAVMERYRSGDISIPDQVEDISLEMLLLQMAEALQRHGSSELRSAIAEHALQVFRLARERGALLAVLG